MPRAYLPVATDHGGMGWWRDLHRGNGLVAGPLEGERHEKGGKHVSSVTERDRANKLCRTSYYSTAN